MFSIQRFRGRRLWLMYDPKIATGTHGLPVHPDHTGLKLENRNCRQLIWCRNYLTFVDYLLLQNLRSISVFGFFHYSIHRLETGKQKLQKCNIVGTKDIRLS